ncbi:site-specific integrase [Cellulomonas phragmiteti]|uniref:site-specific integrase n=1 Tax=Cellulomonas phragmiteti TaxID=478780 RepID=UPI003639A080
MNLAEITTGAPSRALLCSDFALHLRAQRGVSDHTVRAYLGDVDHLLDHAVRHGVTRVDEIDITVLRGWLAAMANADRSRAHAGAPGGRARTFFRWATHTSRVATDPTLRLGTARAAAPCRPCWRSSPSPASSTPRVSVPPTATPSTCATGRP